MQVKEAKTILLFSRDANCKAIFHDNVVLHGWKILELETEQQVFALLEKQNVDIAFLDIERANAGELNLVAFIKMRSPHTEIVVFAPVDRLEDAANTLSSGAAFYLIKPFDRANLQVVLSKLALRLERQEEFLELERDLLEDLMAGSREMQKVLALSAKIAPTSSTVLVGGESGTGKEFFARIIHRLSKRTDGPFVAVNCGGIPDTLFESEMFGHRKGSFTGADRDKTGLVEGANLGTLFLDEVADLSPAAQVKLLRFIQERTFRRIGETTVRTVNVRIIAATNRDLGALVKQEKFREDLFYRLNVFHLYLPPLRDRRETIPGLVKVFVSRNNRALEKQVNSVSKEAQLLLAGYDYPGNVRELENIIEHAMVMVTGNELRGEDLPEFLRASRPRLSAPEPGAPGEAAPGVLTLAELEKRHITAILAAVDNNYGVAAKKLGVSRSTLWRKLKEYGIEKKRAAP